MTQLLQKIQHQNFTLHSYNHHQNNLNVPSPHFLSAHVAVEAHQVLAGILTGGLAAVVS